ncbi:prostasin-like [Engraulis encrasicolus]|uniref:prostasin-like n=1 Tax=Engraulis encrasicolus TaxID=184585 RepID=UPI002FD64BDA
MGDGSVYPPQLNGSTSVIFLEETFKYFGLVYSQIFLSSNGYLTFDGSSPVEPPNSAHSNTDIIAPFWTKFDNSEHKTISYQQITNGSLLQQATSDIQDHFPDLTFSATWIFIANWVFKTESPSFQVVLVSDGNLSFVLMNYGAVQQTSAWAGYDTAGSSNSFWIPVDSVSDLQQYSNVYTPGRWAFRVDEESAAGVRGRVTDQVCGFSSKPPSTLSTRIVSGQDSQPGSWPWQVSIHRSGHHLCGGSLINHGWVISAAHCFKSLCMASLSVYLGRLSQEDGNPNEVRRSVMAIVRHPDDENNIALLRLSAPVRYTAFVKPVCLAASGSFFYTGTNSWVTGWGHVKEGVPLPSPQILQEVEVQVVGNKQCSCSYGDGVITDNMICAGAPKGGKDACLGDTGGPLVSRQESVWVLSGILSFGMGCGDPTSPGVYSRVSRYQHWITAYTSDDLPGFIQFQSDGPDTDKDYTCPSPSTPVTHSTPPVTLFPTAFTTTTEAQITSTSTVATTTHNNIGKHQKTRVTFI